MTIKQIHAAVTPHKPVSQRQTKRYLAQFGIRPQGIRQRPQQYPADSADRILRHLGIQPVRNAMVEAFPPLSDSSRKPAKLPSMAQLRAVRKSAKRTQPRGL